MTQILETREHVTPKPSPAPKRRRRQAVLGIAIVVAVVAVTAMVWAGGGGAKVGVTAQLRDFAIQLDTTTVPAGDVRIRVANSGPSEHELVAFQTDLPEIALPTTGGRIDEAGAGITHLDPEAENVTSGSSKEITLHLAPGRYVIVCNLPTHYASGMHATLIAGAR